MLLTEKWTKLPVLFLLEHINTCARMHDIWEELKIESETKVKYTRDYRISETKTRDQNKCWKIVTCALLYFCFVLFVCSMLNVHANIHYETNVSIRTERQHVKLCNIHFPNWYECNNTSRNKIRKNDDKAKWTMRKAIDQSHQSVIFSQSELTNNKTLILS